ncbi:hypothetical protein EDD29_7595 [Actinocorallia herbida]|uniref:AAA+ ATPase domain-containing protein n=1 Tax=Actinocorallia herbida TaxID=58109 RepID=A0A3N1D8P2_9ACTN|nr:hypothetical protein [Actinocorallia herbida]ROO89885.1 hypothetical protein EDD29_7595 [Actinocorallia herbida]
MLDLRLRDTLDTSPLLASRRGLVGRDAELRELAGLLPAYGALTLTGPAGMGKSALARGLAGLLGPRYPDGCAFADCAALPPDAASGAAADLLLSALRLGRGPSGPLSTVLGAVRDRRALLVLDHVGQLTAGARRAVEDVVRAVRAGDGEGAHVVVVSRDPLGTEGERVWQVPPLDGAAAVRLLLPRQAPGPPALLGPPAPRHAAQPPAPDGTGEPDTRAELAELLGGVPLALELAGALLGRISVRRLRDHLRRRRDLHAAFGLPWPSGERVADWVADLLPARESVLLGRMAVFPGPAGPDAVAAVCGHAPLSAGEVPELLKSLTAAGLLTEAGTLRPGLTESCAARCEDPGLLRDRLLAYCLLTALEGRRPSAADTLAALGWALRPDAGPAAVRAAADLLDAAGADLADDTGPAEALAWTLRALHHPAGLPRHEAGLLHARAGALKARIGDDAEARAHYETALGLFGVEPRGLRRRAEVLGLLVGLDLSAAHPSTAALVAGAAAEARASGDPRAITAVLPSLAVALAHLGREQDALDLLAEAEAAGPLPAPEEAAFVHLRAGDPVECLARTAPLTSRGGLVGARALLARGWARMVGGDLPEAAETLARGEDLATGAGAPAIGAPALLAAFDEAFAHAARLSGDAPSAARRTARTLRRAVERRDVLTGVRAGCLALVLHADTHPEAERIAGIVRECRLRTGLPAWPFPDAEIAELEEALGATGVPPAGWYPDIVPALLAELLDLLES